MGNILTPDVFEKMWEAFVLLDKNEEIQDEYVLTIGRYWGRIPKGI